MRLPRITKPKLLPSLCKQISTVFDITPEVLSGAGKKRKKDTRQRQHALFINLSRFTGLAASLADNSVNKPTCTGRSAKITELIKVANTSARHAIAHGQALQN